MTKETTTMNTTETELKAIAKAIGGSLKRTGHPVPHSAVLHAVAAALDKRDWHKLKAALGGAGAVPATPDAVPALPVYRDNTLFMLRLAYACGTPVSPVPADDEAAMAAAVAALPVEWEGMLSWAGWHVPASLNLRSFRVDAGDFLPEDAGPAGSLKLRFAAGGPALAIEVAHAPSGAGWYITHAGNAAMFAQLEAAVSMEQLLGSAPAEVLPGEPVKAEFWTDDRVFEANFDARPYLLQASDADIKAIIDCHYRGDYPTDYVAEFIANKALDEDVADGFEYIHVLQKAGREDAPGFECSVDKDSFLAWLDAHRPLALALALCEKADVGLAEAQEEEIAGMWDWISPDGSQACEHSFATREEAALDAYYVLGLLQQEQDGAL
jgi:hypothetical protein